MSFIKISESIRESATKIIELINAHLDYYQIVAFDKMIFLMTKVVSSFILGFTAFMVLFFSSFALAEFIGEVFNHVSIGYLLVGLMYGMGGLIVWNNRVNWIINPIIAVLTETVEETAHDFDVNLDDDLAEKPDSFNAKTEE